VPAAKKRSLRDHVYARGLATYRAARGDTQEREAALQGVAWRTWHRWETGAARAPLGALRSVAERWGVPLEVLVDQPQPGPDAQVRRLVAEHGEEQVARATKRVISAL